MPIKRVVIVGDGIAAWLCASALARVLPATTINIQVVKANAEATSIDDSLGAPVLAEASLPSMVQFNRMVGYSENAVVAAMNSGFTLGTVLSVWGQDAPMFNSFGEVGSALGPVGFHHAVLRLRDRNQSIKFANYSLAALCAQANRFSKPEPHDQTALSTLEYGLHFEVPTYRHAMKTDAIARGVRESASSFQQALLNESGIIEAVITLNGERIDGDLFVDCTGASRCLASIVHKTRFTDWTSWMRCNRINNVMVRTNDSPQPYTHLIAQPSGWARSISLPGKHSVSRCFHESSGAVEVDSHVFTTGYHSLPWQKNCIALGGAAVTTDPSISLSMHLLHSGVQRLIDLFPNGQSCEQVAVEYNRQGAAEIECARDYAIAHYKLNAKSGEPFWDECRNMSIPDSLAYRIDVYKNCGRIVMLDGEMMSVMNWLMLFDAAGIQPKQYDVITRSIPVELINEHLSSIRQTLLTTVASLPSYQAYLSQIQ